MKISELFPEGKNGWVMSGEGKIYNRETIFDYIDGGGEVYLTYGFQELFVRTYQKSGESGIVAEIFDMGTAADAFGIFSFEREGDSVDIGRDSEYEAGSLRFWKGRFFITVTSERETRQAQKAVLEIGRSISQRIADAGKRPEILGYLPQKDIVPNEVRFFHKQFNLNYHYFVADANILGLDQSTDAVLAPYLVRDSKGFLLLISYANDEKARQGYASFLHFFMPEATGGIIQTENKKWTAIGRRGHYIVVAFDVPSKEAALRMVEEVLISTQSTRANQDDTKGASS